MVGCPLCRIVARGGAEGGEILRRVDVVARPLRLPAIHPVKCKRRNFRIKFLANHSITWPKGKGMMFRSLEVNEMRYSLCVSNELSTYMCFQFSVLSFRILFLMTACAYHSENSEDTLITQYSNRANIRT